MPDSWEMVREEMRSILQGVLTNLGEDERTVFKEVLRFELEHQHLKQFHYKGPLKDLLERVIRDDSA